MMTYQDALKFLESRLNYERRGMPGQRELRLERVEILLDCLGRPQDSYPVIHIAGTKGKGSTAHLLSAFLVSTGCKVGLHTSPHLVRLEERFRINGNPASEVEVAQLVSELIPLVRRVDRHLPVGQPPLTFFEITTALTLLFFARHAVDWAVVEVGVGGRLDSTNVVKPHTAVITTISRDHMRLLGNDLRSIAAEKAGIIKPGCPVVSGVVASPAREVIEQACQQNGSQLYQLGLDFDYQCRLVAAGSLLRTRTWRQQWPEARLNVLGEHQAMNCATALAVIDVLRERSQLSCDPVRLADSAAQITLPGRVEILSRHPTVVLDVAHNDASARALARILERLPADRATSRGPRLLIFGTSREKEWQSILRILTPQFDHLILTNYQGNPRALPASQIAEQAHDLHLPVTVAGTPALAWQRANELLGTAVRTGSAVNGALPEPLVCITGSFYLAAEMLQVIPQTMAVPA